jgi:ABC-2 type transport system permease protein
MKIDINQIFQERFNDYYREASRYWRLIASSGLLFTVSILTILGLIYYRDFLAWIPGWVPIPVVLSLLFGVLVTRGAHRTLLKEADLLFLTPIERKMDQYFSKTERYNFILQGVGIAILLVILSPLYVDKIPEENQKLLFYFLIPILLKGWNLQSNWVVLRWQDKNKIRYHTALRLTFNVLFLYWFFVGGHILLLLGFSLIILLFYILERKIRISHAYHWLYLIEMDRRLQSRCFIFVN